ncbi:glycosyl hydrolase 115 family protein [Haloferula sp. A504]|uniref:glycosyl hydrolase 115 family protein n=1 Tax=Haloferula sp. A504 TaxID=3373601 RepID=UPI0031C61AF2|nr:glycosyl hydrolase 115 family protein [Verrucomicrobiaceae bacterium E54]
MRCPQPAILRRSLAVLTLAGSLAPHALVAGDPAADSFPLAGAGRAVDIWVAENDWKVARIAARDLAADIGRVGGVPARITHQPAGLSSQAVILGTLGRSALIDQLVETGRLDVADVAGRWETFVITAVDDPLPGVARALVIAGSDRRGTAYGAYEISRRIGVSPWHWWADVTPEQQPELRVSGERTKVGPPAVKYRGIFINDEMWGLRPWAEGTFAPDEGKGIGPKTHAKIFELLLRLRANHLWPAMHLHTIPFNTYEENKQVADDYAIVMGSSHIEPMLRNSFPHAEWDREGGGDWNYLTNRDAIYNYWERRIKANGRHENVYTLGMRGQDDEPMLGGKTREEKIATLERIFRDQREILTRHIDPDPAMIPQVFIPYTEVLGLYDAGMKVPDDVTICWPDDNFGYIRRLPTAAERKRSGGSGIYYHIQWLNGATTAYTWLNTMPPPLIATEMHKAWQHGADRLWVLNVGDIKPGEIGTEFFLDMAWDPGRLGPRDVRRWLTAWAARDLDGRFADEIADIMMDYYQLGFTRRPEFMLQKRGGQPFEMSWFSHDQHGDEASRRLERYAGIAERAEAIYQEIPGSRKAAFYQLVLYPVKGASLMNHKIIHADNSLRAGAAGRATALGHAEQARAAADAIRDLDHHYNHELAGVRDKWRYMMTSTPGPWGGQRHQFEMPPLSEFAGGGPPTLEVAPEGGRPGVVAGLSQYTRGKRFIDLFNQGRGFIQWKATSPQPWLKIEPWNGRFEAGQRLWISIDWDALPANPPKAFIRITSDAADDAVLEVPVFAPASPKRDEVTGHIESHGCVSMEAEHFTRRHDRRGGGWQVIEGLGRHGDSVTVLPATLPGHTEPEAIRSNSPALEFDMHLFSSGEFELHLDCLPTHPASPSEGSRLAVSLDGGEPWIPVESGPKGWEERLSNLRRWKTPVKIDAPGKHTLTVWMVDPGVILDRLVLHTQKPAPSYLGPPESFRR